MSGYEIEEKDDLVAHFQVKQRSIIILFPYPQGEEFKTYRKKEGGKKKKENNSRERGGKERKIKKRGGKVSKKKLIKK